MKKHGHYCKICGEHKANEKFSGKGHAAHICKSCAAMPLEERNQAMTLTRILNLPWYLSKEQCAWLKKRCHDDRPIIKEAAQQAYECRFPFEERNRQKKQYHVDHLSLMVNDDVYDEYGDEISLNAIFRVSRKGSVISMTEDGQEHAVYIPSDKMTKLLKWMVHYLEIFCWQEDYALGKDDWNDDDEWDDAEDESEIIDTPVCWQLDITYRNGVSQQVVSYDSLPDRAEELVWKLMGYLFPMEDEEENPME